MFSQGLENEEGLGNVRQMERSTKAQRPGKEGSELVEIIEER